MWLCVSGGDLSGEAVDLVRTLKMVTPKPITQVAVFAEFDFFLALSGERKLLMWTHITHFLFLLPITPPPPTPLISHFPPLHIPPLLSFLPSLPPFLSDGEVYLITLSGGQIVEQLMKGTKALSFAVDWIRMRTKQGQLVPD